MFYRRLFSVADDYGRYDARPAVLRAHFYPLQIDKMSETGIARCLRECERVRLVRLYSVEERPYLEIEDFGQRVQSKPKWPGPGEGERGRTAVHGGLPFHSEAKSDSDSLFVGDVARGAGRRGEAGSAAPDEAGFRRFVAEVCGGGVCVAPFVEEVAEAADGVRGGGARCVGGFGFVFRRFCVAWCVFCFFDGEGSVWCGVLAADRSRTVFSLHGRCSFPCVSLAEGVGLGLSQIRGGGATRFYGRGAGRLS